MKKIGIIGGGFSGTMTAVHLLRNSIEPIEIIIINERESFNKGIAFNPYSKKHLLNVSTAKMSAFSNEREHFLNWIMKQEDFKSKDKTIVSNSYLPRYLYGLYLSEVWNETIILPNSKKNKIKIIDDYVIDLDAENNFYSLWLSNDEKIIVDACVIANGNQVPRNPKIKNMIFFSSKNYFQNPWDIKSVTNINSDQPVLILGNGLTMVDTVLGLIENGFTNQIFSISPNGFNILPHRHNGMKYSKMVEELSGDASLFEIVKLFNKHIKEVREFGLSAEPIIDSLRTQTQLIWQRLTTAEKKIFMSRLRHLWGGARHRIPLHTHDKIQHLRIENQLHIFAGKLIDITEEKDNLKISFLNKKHKKEEVLKVSRVINCTGPESDLMMIEKSFLKNCFLKGIISQDELKLGINADPDSLEVLDKNGKKNSNLFTLGSNLRGLFWETTAVNELRAQAEKLAKNILKYSNTQNKISVISN